MFWRRRSRLDEEVASHIAEETADNIARGMHPAAAREAAMRTFGNVEAAKETVREKHAWYWLDTLWQDVHFAFRLIARNPWLSATIVATLTTGIALNVSVFSLVNGYLLRPWVRSEPETLISVSPRYSGDYNLRYSDGGMSQPDYAGLRDSAESLSVLAAYRLMNVTLMTDGALINDPDVRQRAPVIFAVTLGTTTVLLLLACVNVTTLLLSRSAARQREIAVRLSLGAGRFRLLRQLLTEGLVLSGVSAGLSLLIVQRGPAVLWNSAVSFPAPFDLKPDWRVLVYCLAVAMLTGVVAGLSPALESFRPQVSESLKGSSGAVTTGPRRSRLRGTLVAVQIALSLLLLVQVGLFTKTERRFFSYDPGFETHQVLNVTFASVIAGFTPPVSFYEELQARLAAVPGVVQMSFTSIAPWSGRNITAVGEIDGAPVPTTGDMRDDPARRMVVPEYFTTLDIGLLRGRVFTRAELSSKTSVVPVVISEAMAQRYWPGRDPIGHQFRLGSRRANTPRSPIVHEVIGVCRDVQSVRYMQDDGPFYYRPLDVQQTRPPYMLVRVSGDTRTPAASIREIVRDIDPQMALTVVTLASTVERQGEQMKPVMMYSSAAGILALLLALTGVYAVVSFSVSQRVREIGIRTALGAQRSDVIALILRSGAAPVSGGLVAGLGLALTLAGIMRSVLVGVNPRDPFTLIVVSLLLLLAAVGAIWIPARRAAALDPLASLRYE